MRTSKDDKLIKVVKTHKLAIKMRSIVFNKCYFLQTFYKMTGKLKHCETFSKVHPIKQKNAQIKLSHISSVTLSIMKARNFEFLVCFWHVTYCSLLH